jgi:hypothetical protein
MRKKVAIILAIIIFLSAAPMPLAQEFSGRFVRTMVAPTMVFDAVYSFRDGLARVGRNCPIDGWQFGFVNGFGEYVIPLEFNMAAVNFCEGLARVGMNCPIDGWSFGFINKEGELVIPLQFDMAWCFHDGITRVVVDGKTGIIDATGQFIIPPTFTHIGGFGFGGNHGRPFWDGLAVVRMGDWGDEDSVFGVIDKSGEFLIPLGQSRIWRRTDGFFDSEKDGLTALINMYGEVVVPHKFERISDFHEGLAAVHLNGEIGFIDKTGELVIPMQAGILGTWNDDWRWRSRWSQSGNFYEGFAVISTRNWSASSWADGNELGLIDREGNLILPFEFDIIRTFSEGLAAVGIGTVTDPDEYGYDGHLSHAFGVIDTSGNFVIPMGEFDSVGSFVNGVAHAHRDGQAGLIDRYGNAIIPFEYRHLEISDCGLVVALRDGENGLYDIYGNVIIPLGEFDSISLWRMENGMITVRKNDMAGMIDREGNIVAQLEPRIYHSVSRVNDEVIMARHGGRAGDPIDFLDNDGNIIYTIPEGITLRDSWVMKGEGFFWITTGDRDTGVYFGILQVSAEEIVIPEPAPEEEPDEDSVSQDETILAFTEEVPAENSNSFWIFLFALIAFAVIGAVIFKKVSSDARNNL